MTKMRRGIESMMAPASRDGLHLARASGLACGMPSGPRVFSGSAHPALARAICRKLGILPGAARTHRFANDNLKVKIEENVRGADVFVVQPSCPPVADGFLELLIFVDALKHASASRVTAVM